MLSESFGESFLKIDFPFPCEIHYRYPRRLEPNGNFKVLVVNSEPTPLCTPIEQIEQIHSFFDLIVANRDDYLRFPNAVLQTFGDMWATELPRRKEFSASFIVSLGANLPQLSGYGERVKVVENAGRIDFPLRLFRGKRPYENFEGLPLLVDDRKDCLFESMFHIAIENNCEINYFSEKLIDCFTTYTVPLYYGCTNIADYFDVSGIIVFRDNDHLIELLNGLTIEDYWRRLPAMMENFRRSQAYWNFSGRLRNVILRAAARP
jgi:hypothetical protein